MQCLILFLSEKSKYHHEKFKRMRSIKELIKVRSLILPVKKEVPVPTEINWNIDLGLDDTNIRKLKKISKWLQLDDESKTVHRILFDGASVAGKTKAVKLIAKQHGLAVYRIKLSEVLSKNSKETEKNLKAIFDAASTKNWILFFDEADALFGKRTDVGNAHDRYANKETSYLLQKLEEYKGLVIFNCKECKGTDRGLAKLFQSVVHFPVKS